MSDILASLPEYNNEDSTSSYSSDDDEPVLMTKARGGRPALTRGVRPGLTRGGLVPNGTNATMSQSQRNLMALACTGRSSRNLMAFEDTQEDDPIYKRMQALLMLQKQLGIDKDKAFLAEHDRKAEEKERLVTMTPEERIAHKQEQLQKETRDWGLKLQELQELKQRQSQRHLVESQESDSEDSETDDEDYDSDDSENGISEKEESHSFEEEEAPVKTQAEYELPPSKPMVDHEKAWDRMAGSAATPEIGFTNKSLLSETSPDTDSPCSQSASDLESPHTKGKNRMPGRLDSVKPVVVDDSKGRKVKKIPNSCEASKNFDEAKKRIRPANTKDGEVQDLNGHSHRSKNGKDNETKHSARRSEDTKAKEGIKHSNIKVLNGSKHNSWHKRNRSTKPLEPDGSPRCSWPLADSEGKQQAKDSKSLNRLTHSFRDTKNTMATGIDGSKHSSKHEEETSSKKQEKRSYGSDSVKTSKEIKSGTPTTIDATVVKTDAAPFGVVLKSKQMRERLSSEHSRTSIHSRDANHQPDGDSLDEAKRCNPTTEKRGPSKPKGPRSSIHKRRQLYEARLQGHKSEGTSAPEEAIQEAVVGDGNKPQKDYRKMFEKAMSRKKVSLHTSEDKKQLISEAGNSDNDPTGGLSGKDGSIRRKKLNMAARWQDSANQKKHHDKSQTHKGPPDASELGKKRETGREYVNENRHGAN